MVSYLRFLADQDAATGASQRKAHEPPAFKTPNRAADLKAGETVFAKRCAACHGPDGAGLAAAPDLVHGFVFPPLWGPNSFNDGAGMHRVLTAARFIKARMPLGSADLTDRRSLRRGRVHQLQAASGDAGTGERLSRSQKEARRHRLRPLRGFFPARATSLRPLPAHRGLLQKLKTAVQIAILSRGRVQRHGGANQSFQSLLVNLVAFAEVDGTPHSTLETGIEET